MNYFNKVKKFFNFISDAQKCMIGACLIYSGLGGVIIWNNISTYLFSYYRERDANLEYSVFSTTVSLIGFFTLISGFLAVQLQMKINYIKVMRIWMPIFTLLLMLTTQTENSMVFIIFYSLLMGITQGLTFVPTLKFLWQHFETKTGAVSGMALSFHGLSSVFYNIIATMIINPDNQEADLDYKENEQLYYLYEEDITDNVPGAMASLSLLFGSFLICGSLLISNKKTYIQYEENSPQKLQQNDNNGIDTQPPKDDAELVESKDRQIAIEFSDNQLNRRMESRDNQVQQFQINRSGSGGSNIGIAVPIGLKRGICSSQFIILYLVNIFEGIQTLFISLNIKNYGKQKNFDDHFLTTIIVCAVIVSSASKIMWGFLFDKGNIKNTFMIIMFFSGMFALTLPFGSGNKAFLFIWIVINDICLKGMMTLQGPSLIKIFGLDLGSQLAVVLYTAFQVGLIFVPLVQSILLTVVTFDGAFIFVGALSLLGCYITSFLNEQYQI